VVHGTHSAAADGIAQFGFAPISIIDSGYYGKGIYFTSSAMYTLPYICKRKDPTLLICYALPGNPFPVIENQAGDESLLGTALKSGYQSHYVLCNRTGHIYQFNNTGNEFYDELVLSHSNQVIPAYKVSLSNDNFLELGRYWNRPIRQPPESTIHMIETPIQPTPTSPNPDQGCTTTTTMNETPSPRNPTQSLTSTNFVEAFSFMTLSETETNVPQLNSNSNGLLTNPKLGPVVPDWTSEEVGKWLVSIGLNNYVNEFKRQSVNGKILLALTEFDLKFELQMNLGDRKNLLLELSKLKPGSRPPSLSKPPLKRPTQTL